MPQKGTRYYYILTVSQIVDTYIELFAGLRSEIPDLHIILTISSVRHWKDGAEDLVHPNNQKIRYIWEKFSDRIKGELSITILYKIIPKEGHFSLSHSIATTSEDSVVLENP